MGLAIGLASAWAHMWLLRRAVASAAGATPADARSRIVRGLPFRLLLVVPGLYVAATIGLGACLGLVVGLFAGRWLFWRYSAGVRGARWP